MPNSARASVLVVDDEPTIREIVARYLERAGYRASVAGDGAQALASSARSAPDLVVLDLMLPGIDGLEVLRRLREQAGEQVRVILLTARGRESERIVGLKAGADDYVVKPFSPNELVARVEAVLRRRAAATSGAQQAPLRFGELCIDPQTRTVTVGEREVGLTAREFDLLLFLARHPGQVFSRDRLMEMVWELSDYEDSSTVTVHVRRLRAKIEPDPERPRHIQTVWGVGYRLRP